MTGSPRSAGLLKALSFTGLPRSLVLACSAFLLGGGLLVAGEKARAVQADMAAQPDLVTLTTGLQEIDREQVFDGVVEAVNESTVSSRTSGNVTEIYFDVNDYVVKGTTLLRIDSAQQTGDLTSAQAAAEDARAQRERAQAEYNRVKKVFAEKLVSKSEMDKAEAALKSAKAQHKAAVARLRQAKDQLDYTEVVAPFSGIVRERKVELGESVQPGTQLMTGISLEDLRVTVSVPQRLVNSVREGAKVRVAYGEGEQSFAAAKRMTFFPYANPVNHTFDVRIYLDKDTADLYPGMFVKVHITVGSKARILLPSSSVVNRGDVTAVYVQKEDGQVSLRMVRVGRHHEGGRVEILTGLEEGEKVAVDPIQAGVFYKEQNRKLEAGDE